MFHINPRKTPWRRFGRRETIMTYEKPFLIRIKKTVKIILKTNNNLESWVTTTTFLLEFHAEANQSKFLKFYPLLKYLKPLKSLEMKNCYANDLCRCLHHVLIEANVCWDAWSWSKNFYDIIAIWKTRIMINLERTKNINLKNYNTEHIPSVLKNQWTWINFIELINSKKQNILIGCIYRHSWDEFSRYYLNSLLKK